MRTQDLDDIVAGSAQRSRERSPHLKDITGIRRIYAFRSTNRWSTGFPAIGLYAKGDIVSVDIGAIVDGYHGDSAWTYAVGEVDEAAKKLLAVGEGALYAGIEMARPGNRLSDISHAVQTYAEGHGYSVVRDFVGHGIGRSMHEAPQVPNFGPPRPGRLKTGMTLAIEPMINAGTHEVAILEDRWTVVTTDGSLSVHFEHTVAITEDGPLVLTAL